MLLREKNVVNNNEYGLRKGEYMNINVYVYVHTYFLIFSNRRIRNGDVSAKFKDGEKNFLREKKKARCRASCL